MTRRRFFKYSLAGFMVLFVLYVIHLTTAVMYFRQLDKSLGTNEEPLTFMARSVKPGMTRPEVAKIVRGYASLKRFPPQNFAPGGTDVYIYHRWFPGQWISFGEYGNIYVRYDADGRVRDAEPERGD